MPYFLVLMEQNLYDFANDELSMMRYYLFTGTPDGETAIRARSEIQLTGILERRGW